MDGERDDGGLAFPGTRYQPILRADGRSDMVPVDHPGMSLRDWFAAHANGIAQDASREYGELFAGRPFPADGLSEDQNQWWQDADAAHRYVWADAMLAARSK